MYRILLVKLILGHNVGNNVSAVGVWRTRTLSSDPITCRVTVYKDTEAATTKSLDLHYHLLDKVNNHNFYKYQSLHKYPSRVHIQYGFTFDVLYYFGESNTV